MNAAQQTREIIRSLSIVQGFAIVAMGCGRGYRLERIAKGRWRLHGYDYTVRTVNGLVARRCALLSKDGTASLTVRGRDVFDVLVKRMSR